MVRDNFAKIGLAARAPVLRWTDSLYASHQIQPLHSSFWRQWPKTSSDLQFAEQRRPGGTNNSLELNRTADSRCPTPGWDWYM